MNAVSGQPDEKEDSFNLSDLESLRKANNRMKSGFDRLASMLEFLGLKTIDHNREKLRQELKELLSKLVKSDTGYTPYMVNLTELAESIRKL